MFTHCQFRRCLLLDRCWVDFASLHPSSIHLLLLRLFLRQSRDTVRRAENTLHSPSVMATGRSAHFTFSPSTKVGITLALTCKPATTYITCPNASKRRVIFLLLHFLFPGLPAHILPFCILTNPFTSSTSCAPCPRSLQRGLPSHFSKLSYQTSERPFNNNNSQQPATSKHASLRQADGVPCSRRKSSIQHTMRYASPASKLTTLLHSGSASSPNPRQAFPHIFSLKLSHKD